MEIQSDRLGIVEVEDSEVFTFAKPLLGFDDYGRFALVRPDQTTPFAYLQSVDEPGLSFLLADPFAFYPHYEFQLSTDDVLRLEQPDFHQVAVWVTVSAGETLRTSTVNLLAPIVFNTAQQVAVQVVLHDSSYQTKVPLFQHQEEGK